MKEESMKHGPFDSVKVTCLVFFLLKLVVRIFHSVNQLMSFLLQVCELHPQGVVLIRFKDRKDAQKCIDAMNGRWYRFSP